MKKQLKSVILAILPITLMCLTSCSMMYAPTPVFLMANTNKLDSGEIRIAGAAGVGTQIFSYGRGFAGSVSFAPKKNLSLSLNSYWTQAGRNGRENTANGARLASRLKLFRHLSLEPGLGYARASHNGQTVMGDLGLIAHTDNPRFNCAGGIRALALKGSNIVNNHEGFYSGFGVNFGMSYLVDKHFSLFGELGGGEVTGDDYTVYENGYLKSYNFAFDGAYVLIGINIHLRPTR